MGSRVRTAAVAVCAVALTVCLVLYPDLAFRSALRGLRIWWFVVFPALLPFFVAGQVLMALGVVHFMGVVLERAMRPLFNVPGVGAFVMAMGLASGYPIGAVLTAKLHREGQLTTVEAERLMGFCNTADPLFMAGAVAVGMLGRPELAGALMAAHYTAALGTGLVLRFHGTRGGPAPVSPGAGMDRRPMLVRALAALEAARAADGRGFGQILGDAVRDSVQTLLLVGGCIIVFAVISDILAKLGLVALVSAALGWGLGPLHIGRSGAAALVSGFFEITIGAQAASHAAAPLLQRVLLCNAIIAWSGLSVFAQVAAVTAGTGIRLGPYVFARVVQAVLAAALTFVFWNPAWAATQPALPVAAVVAGGLGQGTAGFAATFDGALVLLGLVLASGLAVAIALAWRQGARLAWLRSGR